MKKPFALTLMFALSFALAACGKKSDDPVVNTGIAAIGTPVAGTTYGTWPTPWGGGWTGANDLSQCQFFGGQIVGGVCAFTQTVNASWNIYTGAVTTAIGVNAGQKLTVAFASGSPTVFVGSVPYANGSASFNVPYGGYLGFQGLGFYSVQYVQITSCFSGPNQPTLCP